MSFDNQISILMNEIKNPWNYFACEVIQLDNVYLSGTQYVVHATGPQYDIQSLSTEQSNRMPPPPT